MVILGMMILFSFWSCAKICDKKDEVAVFSQCSNEKMSANFYWNTTDCENVNHGPIHNINCSINCPPGQYIGMNSSSYSEACLDCPNNTYSTGNLLRFSENDLNFDQISKYIQVECKWINNEGELNFNKGCISWVSTLNNTRLQVGGYNGSAEVIFEGFMHLNIIKEGYIAFRYQKKIVHDDENSNFQFALIIDEQITYIDEYGSDKEWYIKNFSLTKGNHEVNFALYFHNYLKNIPDLLSINLIEISGIHHPVFSCTRCPYGFSDPGSSSCTRCKEGQYLLNPQDTQCSICPDGSFSL